MARPRALTPEQEQRVIELSAHYSNRQIVQLLTEEGVAVSIGPIARLLSTERKERAEVTREVARESLRQHVLSDLDILQASRDQLNNWRQNLDEGGVPLDPPLRIGERLLIIDRLRNIIAERLKAGGVIDGENTIRIAFVDPDEPDERP